ncbi:MAG: response regulator [Pyrinomonadaceae bacterium]
MINVLFVDDEPNILSALQRMLRGQRSEWQMSFASSGEEALNILAETDVDVIVSDMKMPGMDGAELLEKVSELHPHIVRVILSGYSEKEGSIRSVGSAHQYLSKPCDPEVLKTTIASVCAQRELLTDQTLRRLVSQLPSIPSLPGIYVELVDELGKPDCSTRRIAETIRKDIGMTVKILQIVNSAFFGLARPVSDARTAVEFLGLDTISGLTLGVGVISQFEQRAPGAMFGELWAHSMSVGVAASNIAAIEKSNCGSDAFTAGLLHDVGRIILAVNLPDDYRSACDLSESEHISMVDAETQIFGATHADVGAYLLGLWGLPGEVVRAVASHHSPSALPGEKFTALTAVHAANGILRRSHSEEDGCDTKLNLDYLSQVGLVERLPVWREVFGAQAADPVLAVW